MSHPPLLNDSLTDPNTVTDESKPGQSPPPAGKPKLLPWLIGGALLLGGGGYWWWSQSQASGTPQGGMMDCDGDRREYARAQSENFILRNSRDVPTPPTCKVEEACTSDIIGATIAGLNGFTTSEKLEKLGRDANAVNSTANMFGGALRRRGMMNE